MRIVETISSQAKWLPSKAKAVRKARVIMGWVDGLARTAARTAPVRRGRAPGSWIDAGGYAICTDVRQQLERLSSGLSDPDVPRVLGLWDQYCTRYERPRNPARRVPASAPGAP